MQNNRIKTNDSHINSTLGELPVVGGAVCDIIPVSFTCTIDTIIGKSSSDSQWLILNHFPLLYCDSIV